MLRSTLSAAATSASIDIDCRWRRNYRLRGKLEHFVKLLKEKRPKSSKALWEDPISHTFFDWFDLYIKLEGGDRHSHGRYMPELAAKICKRLDEESENLEAVSKGKGNHGRAGKFCHAVWDVFFYAENRDCHWRGLAA